MSSKDVPTCVACDCNLTVEHILIECGDFAEVRQNYIMMLRVYNSYSRKPVLPVLHVYLTSEMRDSTVL